MFFSASVETEVRSCEVIIDQFLPPAGLTLMNKLWEGPKSMWKISLSGGQFTGVQPYRGHLKARSDEIYHLASGLKQNMKQM